MRIVYLIVLILFAITNTYGQVAIKVSTEKVKIGESTYYAHTVQKKETLHSLSKAYNVSIAEIIKNNESAAAGLKAGAVLLIPIKADAATEEKFFAETAAKLEPKLIIPVHWDNFFSPLDKPVTGMPPLIEHTEAVFHKLAMYCEANGIDGIFYAGNLRYRYLDEAFR